MIDFLQQGQVGNIELNEQRRIRDEITARWDKLHMTEGLEGNIKDTVSMLFENQAARLLREATSAESSGSFETVVFPIIRRVFSKLLANDIVSVQAMNLPIGKLFFIIPQTSEREWEIVGDEAVGSHRGLMGYTRKDRNMPNSEWNRFHLPDEALATKDFMVYDDVTDPTDAGTAAAGTKYHSLRALYGKSKDIKQTAPTTVSYEAKSLYDLFYNDYLYDNSKGTIVVRKGATELGVFDGRGVKPFDGTNVVPVPEADGTFHAVQARINIGYRQGTQGKLVGPDGNMMDTESFLASLKIVPTAAIAAVDPTVSVEFAALEEIPFRLLTQKYGSGIVDKDGIILVEIDFTKPLNGTATGYAGIDPTAMTALLAQGAINAYWSEYDSLEFESEIGEVSFNLDSVTISTEERKLRATWSPELAQDVNAFHNIDAEAELTALLSEQIAAEIDREILRDLRRVSPWQLRWDYNGWRKMNGYSTNYTQKDWNQELITKINQISAQIHKATLRGGANFIVVSSEVSAVFDNLEYFHVSDASAESDQYNMGIERVGSLQGRYQVYRDPLSPPESILIGHKGKSILDTGYVYAPYIPMRLTPTIYNPSNFAPVKGILTRYAKKCVNNRYYGAIRVDGLTRFNMDELR